MSEQQHDPELGAPAGGPDDPLLRLRVELEDVTTRPLAERAEVFEQAHRVVTAELRALELG